MKVRWSRRDVLRVSAGASGALLAGVSETACRAGVPACKSVPPNPFVEQGRPLLVVVEGEDISAMMTKGIEVLGGLDRLTALGREALLKGSYVTAQPYPVTTAADHILAVADALKRAGFQRTPLFEAQGSYLVPAFTPETAMRTTGVYDRVKGAGVEILACDFFERDDFRLVRNPKWSIDAPVAVHRKIHDAAVVIGLSPLKRHAAARLTCALKLHFGSVGIADRLVAHKNEKAEYFDQRLVHFADAVKPQLTVVDARAILTRNGPSLSAGSEIVRGVNRIVLCGDMVATDAYCARLMAKHDPTFSPEMIDAQLRQASALGLGTADLDAVKIVEVRA
jgi:uncharacterized protein (DUF362 family)